MKYLYSLLIAVTLAPFISWAQSEKEELLTWNPTEKLTWADFKASPNPNSDAAASTTTYLGIDYNISSTSFSYKIESRFSKTRSWGLYKSAYILSHEQGHFDIAEIFARKLHKAMSEYKFNRKTYSKDLRKIYEEVTKEKEKLQNEYDEETRHSTYKGKQADWLKKIEKMLVELEDYADY